MKKLLLIFALFVIWLFVFSEKLHAQVVINEFVPDSNQEWIEFHNSSASADYLKAYYVDDDTDFLSDSGSSPKKLLSSLNIINPTFPTTDTSSFLNNTGDWVVLFDQSGNLVDQYQFTTNPGKDVSMGRYPDSSGTFSVLAYSTKADANSAPPTPVPTPTPTPPSSPSPTLTSTLVPTPIKTPTSIPTRSPTPFASPKPTMKTGTPMPTNSPVVEVLGQETVFLTPLPTMTQKPIENPKKSFPFLAIGLIVLGLGFVGFAIYTIMRNVKGESSKIS